MAGQLQSSEVKLKRGMIEVESSKYEAGYSWQPVENSVSLRLRTWPNTVRPETSCRMSSEAQSDRSSASKHSGS